MSSQSKGTAVKNVPLFIPVSQRAAAAPCFIDGACSYKSYLIVSSNVFVAKRDINNTNVSEKVALGIRHLGNGKYRVHAYPDFKTFGQPELREYHRTNGGYDGAHLNTDGVTAMLLKLQETPGFVTVNPALALETVKTGYQSDTHASM